MTIISNYKGIKFEVRSMSELIAAMETVDSAVPEFNPDQIVEGMAVDGCEILIATQTMEA